MQTANIFSYIWPTWPKWLFFLICLFTFPGSVNAQEKDRYVFGETGKLEMVVHIIGEVKRPGEYRVSDRTNLVELLSKAGGPTQFSKLSGVTITRTNLRLIANGKMDLGRWKIGKEVLIS